MIVPKRCLRPPPSAEGDGSNSATTFPENGEQYSCTAMWVLAFVHARPGIRQGLNCTTYKSISHALTGTGWGDATQEVNPTV